mmetsp:Transcript_17692/g.18340  ORF Transcript_17692/g.18340 Transcript_17692/m.18340 type:complete len:429 (-) Transcript_17692:26-1312(-)
MASSNISDMLHKDSNDHSSIKEVWASNFEEEIKNISELYDRYPYISMDTEFPGIIHTISSKVKESTYKSIKANVDDMKLIQFGITLSDEKGNCPEICTWQFNMSFDVKSDKHSNDSIKLLSNSGICFDKLTELGILPEEFGSFITTSGLVLNDDIKWVSFHGSYDFAYLIKLLTNQPLPETEQGFFDLLKIYFPLFYDIRHLTKNLEGFSKSLQKLALELDIERVGTQHQAGSDSMVTSRVYHKITSLYLSPDSLKGDENVLFGLGHYYEDESTTVFDSSHLIPMNMNNMGNVNNMGGINGNMNSNSVSGFNSSGAPSTSTPSGMNVNNSKGNYNQYEMNYFHPNQYGYPNVNQNFYRGNPGSFTYSYPQYNPNFGHQGYPMQGEYMMQGGAQGNIGSNVGTTSNSNMMMNNSNGEENKKRNFPNMNS